jgi:hypothetical protein
MNKIQEFEMWCKNMDNQLEQANKAGIPLIVQDMNNKKYPSGYYPKIEYYAEQLMQAVLEGNLREIDRTHRKLNHFIDQQWKVEFGQ